MSNIVSGWRAWGVRPGIGLLLVTVLVSGVSNFVNFRAVQGTDVDAWIAVRNAAVAALLVAPALLLGRGVRRRLTLRDWLRLGLIGLVGGSVPFLLYFHGFQLAASQGGAASASLGYRCLFLVASLMGLLFLRERMPRRFLAAAGLLFGGNLLLLSVTGPLWTDGTAFVLLATGLWAGEYTLSKRALGTLPSGTVALGRMGFGAAFLLAYVGVTGHAGSVIAFTSADWMSLSLSALLLFAFVTTWYAGLRDVELSLASSLLVLAFPVTWALGLLTSGSTPAWGQLGGALAILSGALWLIWVSSLHRRRSLAERSTAIREAE